MPGRPARQGLSPLRPGAALTSSHVTGRLPPRRVRPGRRSRQWSGPIARPTAPGQRLIGIQPTSAHSGPGGGPQPRRHRPNGANVSGRGTLAIHEGVQRPAWPARRVTQRGPQASGSGRGRCCDQGGQPGGPGPPGAGRGPVRRGIRRGFPAQPAGGCGRHPGPAPHRHPGALTHGPACPARHRHGRPDLRLPGSPGHLWPKLPSTSPGRHQSAPDLRRRSWAAQASP
jgi:hypothetical protein